MAMKITSPVFQEGESIPRKYTCDGVGVSPPLRFEDIPAGTVSLALIFDDPDAPGGVWDHWVVWNMPPTTSHLDEGRPVPGVVGRNSWQRNTYGGPCPPDREHRYVFALYALDTKLQLATTAGAAALVRAMAGHVFTRAQVTGRYVRPRRART
jgi:Raf kinase inhibitor-like YbhB/YbcL family protein